MKGRRELLKKSYNLGYFVGFYGHSEWLSWISKEKEEIYSEAKAAGIYEAVRKAYSAGKSEGIRKRESLIRKGLSEEPEERVLERLASFLEEELEWIEREGHLSLLRPVKDASPKRLLRKHGMLEKPKFFNLPRFLRG
ncbi:hypothetical protein [Thermococcus sp.]